MTVKLQATGPETNDATFSDSAASIFAVGRAPVSSNPVVVTLPSGWDSGDLAFATIELDDTGGSLGAIVGANISGGDLSITFENPPSNLDGFVQWQVLRPLPPTPSS